MCISWSYCDLQMEDVDVKSRGRRQCLKDAGHKLFCFFIILLFQIPMANMIGFTFQAILLHTVKDIIFFGCDIRLHDHR